MIGNKCLVVLGMHRSGTSAVTSALPLLGFELGDNLMPPAEGNNELGFFEDLDIFAINEEILNLSRRTWSLSGGLEQQWWNDDRFEDVKGRARKLLERKCESYPMFAFKDPRTAFLLPFWKAVFRDLNLDVSYIICVRHPYSVRDSLCARDGLAEEHALAIWAQCHAVIIDNVVDAVHVFVDYDVFVSDRSSMLARIARILSLDIPKNYEHSLSKHIEIYGSSSLRHHFHSENIDPSAGLLQSAVFNIHAWLRARCCDRPVDEGDCLSDFRKYSTAKQPWLSFFDEANWIALDYRRRFERSDLNSREMEYRARGESEQLKRKIYEVTKECESLKQQHSDLERLYINVRDRADQLDLDVQRLRQLLAQSRVEIEEMKASRSWYLTRPLRALVRHREAPGYLVRLAITRALQFAAARLPENDIKGRLRALTLRKMRPLIVQAPVPDSAEWRASDLIGSQGALLVDDEPLQSVRLNPHKLSFEPAVKLIAFYLPQFHSIPENDRWWGEGFTEWSNVKPANPQYLGHYQPHVPHDLGYYDLGDLDVMRKQIEIAKTYGIGAFCFYLYWFNGHRLLEKPLDAFLEDQTLDFPFCLCWANENWSRRWDGLDQEILMEQQYSEEDDLAFIRELSKYMRDSRYLRVGGKPLVLVYRPSLLPDPAATARRWRQWCRDNGVGEIYLSFTTSFDNFEPATIGFDAAVEFPPNRSKPPVVSHLVRPVVDDFQGIVFDGRVFLERSKSYQDPGYRIHRGVCPSWDNTARRKNKGISFVNFTPRRFQAWLLNAMQDTVARCDDKSERLVFINAWNEWAEGAHLEPDQRYGYAFLEAVRTALARLHVLEHRSRMPAVDRLAVVVHAYYPDILPEILSRLGRVNDVSVKVFITFPADKEQAVLDCISGFPHPVEMLSVDNHGRDVLPFLKVLPSVMSQGFEWLIKVHTKKSPHRLDGDIWRSELFDSLLLPSAIKQLADRFACSPGTGIIGPSGHVVSMGYYWGANERNVTALSNRMGISVSDLQSLTFVAGTMFAARLEALFPLFNLALQSEDFEGESGQVDGTMAHAIERAIAVSAYSAGLSVESTDLCVVKGDYAFAEVTPSSSGQPA